MPITWKTNDNGDWVDISFSDPYSVAESERVMREVFATRVVKRPLRFLVDVRKSTPPSTEFVVTAINFWQLHVAEMWSAKVAVVTDADAQAAKAQLSDDAAQSRELPFAVRNFAAGELAAAQRWLSE